MHGLLKIVSIAVAIAIYVPCYALDLDRKLPFNIPSQSLDQAIVEFSRQSNLQVLTPGNEAQDLRSDEVTGTLPIGTALTLLLAGSGLSFKGIGESTLSIGKFGEATSPSGASQDPAGLSVTDRTDHGQHPAPATTDSLEEIIVTATRVAVPLSKAPVSVSAFTQRKLDSLGVRTIDDLGRLTPGLDFDRNGFGFQSTIAIRGISSSVGSATTGIYIDETPIQARTLGNSSGNAYPVVFDLERVEVLRGPQGTLFGAASEGGNVRFISPEPSLDAFHGYTRSELASTEHGDPSYEVGAAIGGPIVTDTLGFRASVYYRRDGGYIDRERFLDPSSGEDNSNYLDSSAVRLAFKWVPFAGLSITPSVFHEELYQNDTPTVWSILSNPTTQTYVSGNGSNSSSHDHFALPALVIRYERERIELVSDTSYYDRRESSVYDYTLFDISYFSPGGNPATFYSIPGYFSNSPQSNAQHNFVQELRMQSAHPEDRLSWVLGLFYSDASQNARETVNTPFLSNYLGAPVQAVFGYPLIQGLIGYIDNFDNKDIETAAFGNLDLRLDERWKLSTGVRLSRARFDYSEAKDGPAAGGPSSSVGSEHESPVTPKVTLSDQEDGNTLVYASAAKGYRIGGANPPIPFYPGCAAALASLGLVSAPLTYKADSTWSYELGAKYRSPDGQGELSGSVFYIDWSNIIQGVPTLPNCPFGFTSNLGHASSKGFDIQGEVNVGGALTFGASASFTDAKYTRTVRSAGASQDLVSAGHTLGGSPWVLVATAEYRLFGFIGRESYLDVVADYRSENDGRTSTNDPNYSTFDPKIPNPPASTRVDLRAGARLDDGWDIALFAKNLLNQHPLSDYTRDAVGVEVFHYFPARPRTVGITVSRQF